MDGNIAVALEGLMTGFEEFKTRSDVKFKTIESAFGKLEAKAGRPGAGGGTMFGSSEVETERKNLNAFCRGEFKSLTVAIDPQAGYFVPEVLQQSMTEKLYDTPTFLGLVRNENWSGPGSEWIEPLRRALLTARRRGSETETAQDTGMTNPVGLLTIPAGESECDVTLSQKLIDDSSRDLSAMVVGDMNASLDRQLDAEIVSGIGASSQAQGFLSVPIVTTDDSTRDWGKIQYVPSGATTSVTPDSLFDLMYSLRAVYRTGGTFVMSSATANSIDKLKSGDGEYLWRNSMSAGQPPTLLGFPVAFDENMPVIGAQAYPIAFGNWKLGYLAVKKNQMRLIRDPYSSKPNIVLYGYLRQGGAVANSEAIKLLKVGTA